MRRVISIAVAACLVCSTGLLAAAAGRYVSVEIESFRSWGVLRWGTWESVDARLLSTRISALQRSETEALAAAITRCAAATGSRGAELASCRTLEQIQTQREITYSLNAMLGRPYRIKIRNLTDGHLGIVLAIDGLNTNGNQPIVGDVSDRKWILRPRQEVVLSGWQISPTEALQFEFATPSRSHSVMEELRGLIQISVYPDDPYAREGERGTQAGPMIDQPTVVLPFASATTQPVETLRFDYSRRRVLLGIQCEETSGAGIRVAAVVDGTAARQAGLRAGDVITYVNALPINSCSDLQSLLSTRRPGDRVVLKVHRPDRVFLVTVELEE